MAEIVETVSEDYERGFKDGLKSECLEELKPLMAKLIEGCTEAIKGITPMLIDKAHLTIKHAVNRWIPCSKHMMPYGEKVLVRLTNGEFFVMSRSTNSISDGLRHLTDLSVVTHWMPLPEPPKGGADHA